MSFSDGVAAVTAVVVSFWQTFNAPDWAYKTAFVYITIGIIILVTGVMSTAVNVGVKALEIKAKAWWNKKMKEWQLIGQ